MYMLSKLVQNLLSFRADGRGSTHFCSLSVVAYFFQLYDGKIVIFQFALPLILFGLFRLWVESKLMEKFKAKNVIEH